LFVNTKHFPRKNLFDHIIKDIFLPLDFFDLGLEYSSGPIISRNKCHNDGQFPQNDKTDFLPISFEKKELSIYQKSPWVNNVVKLNNYATNTLKQLDSLRPHPIAFPWFFQKNFEAIFFEVFRFLTKDRISVD